MSERADRIEARLDEIEARLDALEAKVPKCKAFVVPRMEEVYGYFTGNGGSRLMADDFFDFYASKGWVVGKTKMKEWERSASRWIRHNKPVSPLVPDRSPEDVRTQAMEQRAKEVISQRRREAETAVPMPAELRKSIRVPT